MRGWIIGTYALLVAGAAQAQQVSEPYATAGQWELTAENHKACMMKREFVIKGTGDAQVLAIYTDPQGDVTVLGWGTHKPKLPPLSDSLDFGLTFIRKGMPLNKTWGSQPFEIDKFGDEYRFSHVFKGSLGSDRFLGDLASSEIISLWFGPALMMSLPLDASDAVTKLRECSSKIVDQDTSGRLQK